MAGTINSHFHDNDDFHLPPASLYVPIEKTIAGWASGELKPKGMPADKFAEALVGDIVGSGKAGLLWRGVNANPIRFLAQFAPQFLAVSIDDPKHPPCDDDAEVPPRWFRTPP